MTDQPVHDQTPSDQPADIGSASPSDVALAYRAASTNWAIGVFEIIFAAALAGFLFWAGSQTADEIHHRFFEGRLSYADWLTIHPRLNGFGTAILLFGVLPGAIYIACGFKLKRLVHRAGLVAAGLAVVQSFVLAGLLTMRLGSVFAAADPPAMTMSVLAIGTPIAALFYIARCSWAVWQLRYRP